MCDTIVSLYNGQFYFSGLLYEESSFISREKAPLHQQGVFDKMSRLADVPATQPDAAFPLIAAFEANPSEQKVDLCSGFYRDENSQPWALPSVAQVRHCV
jgi:hypothetical protein